MGLAVPKMGNLILVAIAVIALSAVLLLWVVPTLIPQVVGFLQDIGIIPGEELTNLEDAILCAYYRCVKGCDSDEVKNLEIHVSENDVKNCKRDFCDPFKEDGKVCGDNAKNNPVIIFMEEPTTIEDDFWEDLKNDPRAAIYHCPTYHSMDYCENQVTECGPRYVDLIVPFSASCTSHSTITGAVVIDSCELQGGINYYVFQGYGPPLNYHSMIICDKEPE